MVPCENGTKQNEKAGAMERNFPSRRLTWKLAANRLVAICQLSEDASVEAQLRARVFKL